VALKNRLGASQTRGQLPVVQACNPDWDDRGSSPDRAGSSRDSHPQPIGHSSLSVCLQLHGMLSLGG
jgi:hypothetical protein